MKGRSGSTGPKTTHQVPGQFEHVEQARERQSFSETHSTLQRKKLARSHLTVAIAGLVIALLLGVLFVNYASKLFETWRERDLLQKATTLLQEGKFSKTQHIAHHLPLLPPAPLLTLPI